MLLNSTRLDTDSFTIETITSPTSRTTALKVGPQCGRQDMVFHGRRRRFRRLGSDRSVCAAGGRPWVKNENG